MHVVYLVNVNICKVSAKIVKGPTKTTFYGPVLFYFCPRKLILRDLKHYVLCCCPHGQTVQTKNSLYKAPKGSESNLKYLNRVEFVSIYLFVRSFVWKKYFQACLTIKVYDCYILYRFIQRKWLIEGEFSIDKNRIVQ